MPIDRFRRQIGDIDLRGRIILSRNIQGRANCECQGTNRSKNRGAEQIHIFKYRAIVYESQPAFAIYSSGPSSTSSITGAAKWWKFGIKEKEASDLVKSIKQKHNPDLILFASHGGFGLDQKFAQRVNGIDVLASGHTHDEIFDSVVLLGISKGPARRAGEELFHLPGRARPMRPKGTSPESHLVQTMLP